MSEVNTKQIMREIEVKAEAQVMNKLQTGQLVTPLTSDATQTELQKSQDVLVSIMQNGADEFQQKVGRPMTYSEMRQMFG